MKKILFSISLSVCCIYAFATTIYTTSCGTKGYTVDQSCFETFGEWADYMQSINEAECGEKGNMKFQQISKN